MVGRRWRLVKRTSLPKSRFLATLNSVRVLCSSSPLRLASESCSSSFFIWLSDDICSRETAVKQSCHVTNLSNHHLAGSWLWLSADCPAMWPGRPPPSSSFVFPSPVWFWSAAELHIARSALPRPRCASSSKRQPAPQTGPKTLPGLASDAETQPPASCSPPTVDPTEVDLESQWLF